jgi:ATP-dependent Clp protease ATP-binding subunit ClpX
MILEDLMLDLMYHLPSQRTIREFVVTEEMVLKHEILFDPSLFEKAS